jgi:CheY-like chemotaxis protein
MTSDLNPPLVLVVDDDADTRELYRMMLESVGYRVEDVASVSSADAALALRPDVVLTDWLLPDGNGLDVCRALGRRVLTRHVPVVAVTGLTLAGEAVNVEECPAIVRLLQKPADPDAILAGIREAAMIGLGRRLRAAAARAKRYAEKIRRRTRRPGDIRADAEALLQRAVARSGDSVTLMIADDHARYVAASGPTRELTGYGSNELATLSVWDLTPLPNTPEGQHLWQQFIEAGTQEGHCLLRHRDGRAVEARYVALANIAPGWHLSAIAEAPDMPASLAGR